MEQEIKVGSVLVSSWGYEQTNVDFYEVVRATGKSVWLRKMAAKIDSGEGLSSMAGYATPNGSGLGEIVGPKRIGKYGVKVRSYASAHVWDGKPKYVSWYG